MLEAFYWTSLPAEIRLMILSTVAYRKHPGWALLASVCREWQYVLEKVNFYKIKLGLSCLDDVEYFISPQKREMIHHICLEIELPRYTSTCCSKKRTPSAKISSIVSAGIWKLFSILSTWKRASHSALEINVYSPSDCEHWFPNLGLSTDDVEQDGHAMSDVRKATTPYHDPQHGWMHGQRVKAPPTSAVLRLFRPVELVFHETLPRVEAVTCHILRRQLRRCISPSGLGLLLGGLDSLEDMFYEPWAPYGAFDRVYHDLGVCQCL